MLTSMRPRSSGCNWTTTRCEPACAASWLTTTAACCVAGLCCEGGVPGATAATGAGGGAAGPEATGSATVDAAALAPATAGAGAGAGGLSGVGVAGFGSARAAGLCVACGCTVAGRVTPATVAARAGAGELVAGTPTGNEFGAGELGVKAGKAVVSRAATLAGAAAACVVVGLPAGTADDGSANFAGPAARAGSNPDAPAACGRIADGMIAGSVVSVTCENIGACIGCGGA